MGDVGNRQQPSPQDDAGLMSLAPPEEARLLTLPAHASSSARAACCMRIAAVILACTACGAESWLSAAMQVRGWAIG